MTKQRMDEIVLDALRRHGLEGVVIDVAPTSHGRLLRAGLAERFLDRAGQTCVRAKEAHPLEGWNLRAPSGTSIRHTDFLDGWIEKPR